MFFTITEIGMKEWLVPQISEHCPKKTPVSLGNRLRLFRRPGIASTFNANEGTAQEWITSSEVINSRLEWFSGREGVKLVFMSRCLLDASMNESSSTPIEGTSYDQYHCRPVTFIVRWGDLDSSIRYRIFMDGRAITHRKKNGRTVQMISISCLSVLKLLKLFCRVGRTVKYSVRTVSRMIIVILWS